MEADKSNLTEQLLPPADPDEEFIGSGLTEHEEEQIYVDETEETDQAWARGEKQPVHFRDVSFAVLFYLQLIAVISVAIIVPLKESTNSSFGSNERISNQKGVLLFCLAVAAMSFVIASISLSIMSMYSQSLVQISLLFSTTMSVSMAILAIFQSNVLGIISGVLLAFVSSCYACAVWRRIPFAAANLKTGLTAVTTNWGVTAIAYVISALSVVYLAVIMFDIFLTYQCSNGACDQGHNEKIFLVLFLLALFWSLQVFKNTIHVTIAGTVGEWWFNPTNASSCCSRAIWDSLFRATTFSFGSICCGSLLVAVIQTLRQLVYTARHNDENNAILLCIAECILSLLEDLGKVFNKWAFVYVGLYGYKYVDAGKNVSTLFQQRGWTTIISDDLVSNTLSLVCLALGALSGCIGLVINAVCKGWLEDIGDSSNSFAFM
mmetsp:Transcript_5266/g.15270  ORF Transcript_5266/g.15270 Transcript_5266/m.15270 type:complete len:434 (-) Transcript_5266:4582-5883(-)